MQLKWPMLWDLFSLFPAHAGVILTTPKYPVMDDAFPRTRGGDPSSLFFVRLVMFFSPHTRG